MYKRNGEIKTRVHKVSTLSGKRGTGSLHRNTRKRTVSRRSTGEYIEHRGKAGLRKVGELEKTTLKRRKKISIHGKGRRRSYGKNPENLRKDGH